MRSTKRSLMVEVTGSAELLASVLPWEVMLGRDGHSAGWAVRGRISEDDPAEVSTGRPR